MVACSDIHRRMLRIENSERNNSMEPQKYVQPTSSMSRLLRPVQGSILSRFEMEHNDFSCILACLLFHNECFMYFSRH